MNLSQELSTCLNLVREVATLIKKIPSTELTVSQKSHDQGPVTKADLLANDFLIKHLAEAFPQDTIVSEEAPPPTKPNTSTRIWYIDPIDGTKEFIKKSGEWSIMLGLSIEGKSSLGVVYQPELDKLYYAVKGQGAFLLSPQHPTPHPLQCSSSEEGVRLIQSRGHYDPKIDLLCQNLGISKTLKQGSIGLKLGRIAEGEADIYLNLSGKCHTWDLCGPEIILQEAGGVVVDETGNSIRYDFSLNSLKKSFLATSGPELAKICLEIFKK